MKKSTQNKISHGIIASLFISLAILTFTKESPAKKIEVVTPAEYKFKPAQEILCMAKNIYHESANESIKGQQAVFAVTMNRLKSKKHGDSICKVVYEYKQFSWTLESSKVKAIPKDEKFNTILFNVVNWMNKGITSPVKNSTQYHADYVSPYWKADFKKIKQIGTHIFYEKI